MKKQIVLVSMCLVLTACASLRELTGYYLMDQPQCANANWFSVGYADGESGDASRYHRYAESCLRFQITPDKAAYHQGFAEGYDAFVEQYCTPDNGFQLGKKGNTYQDICPGASYDAFIDAYEEGLHQYTLNYCTYDNGYALGRSGSDHKRICTPDYGDGFLVAYTRGKKIYETELRLLDELDLIESEIDDVEDSISSRQKKLRRCEDDACRDFQEGRIEQLEDTLFELRFDRRDLKSTLKTLDLVEAISP